MTALPPAVDFTASTVTEANFKTAITDLRAFLDENLSAIGGGKIGINIASPDGTLHVHTASAGAVTANAAADDLVIENSVAAGLTILTPNTVTGSIVFGDPEDNNVGFIEYDHASNRYRIAANGSEVMRIDSAGQVFVGETVNANITVGLTLNQGANDDQILAVKSTDVGHPFTALAELDTYGAVLKQTALAGGLRIEGYRDADGTASLALVLVGFLGEAADTTDTATSNGVILLRGEVTDGGTSSTALAATGNLLTINNASNTRFLVKGDGTLHATNVTAGAGDLDGVALDGEDDIGLVRVFERTVHKGMGIAMSKWDEGIRNNEDDLKRLGVLSSEGDFYNVQRMTSLLGGAIWQINCHERETRELVEDIVSRLVLTERKLAALPPM